MVRDGGTTWRADSGQGLLSFGVELEVTSPQVPSQVNSHESKPRETSISSFRARRPPPPAASVLAQANQRPTAALRLLGEH